MISPREHLKSLHRTPDDPESHVPYLRLDKNERIVPFAKEIMKRFYALMTEDRVMMYPELEPLYQKISSFWSTKRDELFLAHGSDIGIKTVYETYVAPGDRVILHLPSYAMQNIYSKIFQAKVAAIPCTNNLMLDAPAYLEAITPGTRMVVLENPNGFTGTTTPIATIRKIVKKAHQCGAVALLDESYYLFTGQTVQPLYLEYDNVIITRTFSKDLGMAGLRCAYLLSQKQNIESLKRVRPMHETNGAAVAFALACLEYPDLLNRYVTEIQDSVRYLKAALKKMGFPTAGGAGNFLLIQLGEKINILEVIKALRAKKVLVRRPFEVEAMKGWLRVGIGTREQMDHFLTIFRGVLKILA